MALVRNSIQLGTYKLEWPSTFQELTPVLHREVSECPHPQAMLAQRFLKYHETLQKTKKLSVRYLSELSAGNLVTDYGKNLWNIGMRCGGCTTSRNLQKTFKYAPVPEGDKWRIDVVKDLLEVKWNIAEIENMETNSDELDELLKILCSS